LSRPTAYFNWNDLPANNVGGDRLTTEGSNTTDDGRATPLLRVFGA
jgi:hypothetical protein